MKYIVTSIMPTTTEPVVNTVELTDLEIAIRTAVEVAKVYGITTDDKLVRKSLKDFGKYRHQYHVYRERGWREVRLEVDEGV